MRRQERNAVDEVEMLRCLPPEPISLATPIGDDGATEFGDLLQDRTSIPPEESAHAELQSALLSRCLGTLPDRSRRVLEMRFGLNGTQSRSLKQVGLVLGLTAERTRQIEAAGLRTLRALGESQYLREAADRPAAIAAAARTIRRPTSAGGARLPPRVPTGGSRGVRATRQDERREP